MAHQAVVIGGGISGLAAAALLAQSGFEVTLLEKNAAFGGRARPLTLNGFHFDMGPSWYLMPEVFENFFAQFNQAPSDHYILKRLDPRYRIYSGNHPPLTLKDNIEKNQALFESIEPGAGNALNQYLSKLEQAYGLTTELLYHDVNQLKAWLDPKKLTQLIQLAALLKPYKSWHQLSSSYFKDPRLQQIVEFPAVFLGGSPYNTPALYALLSWADFGKGVYYPAGGMHELIKALIKLARDHGANLFPNQEVTRISLKNNQIAALHTQTQTLKPDIVLSTIDLHHLETRLVPSSHQTYPPSYWQSKTTGISALLVFLGLNQRLKNVTHHTLYFADNWQRNFEQINKQQIPEDPSFYLSARSVTDRTIVPKDAEELFILVPLAAKDYEQTALINLADRTIQKIEALIGQAISPHITAQKLYTPKDFQTDYHAFHGTALGLGHTLKQSLMLRPGTKSKKLTNLYYAGQYTNPGVGVPMALISAQLAHQRILHEH